MVSSAESPGIDKSVNGSEWMGGWVTFLPPLGLTKPGRRTPPCEESPGSGLSGESGPGSWGERLILRICKTPVKSAAQKYRIFLPFHMLTSGYYVEIRIVKAFCQCSTGSGILSDGGQTKQTKNKKISRSDGTNFIQHEHIVLNLGLKENPIVIKRSV